MDVILLEKIRKLGGLGDTVKVKPGYARNFLLPQGKAVMATADNITAFEARRAELEKEQATVLEAATARAAQLADLHISVTSKAGDGGRLFGSIGPQDIATAITEAGVSVAKGEVRLSDGPLREVGEHTVSLHLYADVDADVVVEILAET